MPQFPKLPLLESIIIKEKTSCYVCHDSHGSQYYDHLISFDSQIVSPSRNGQIDFIDSGTFRGSCYLNCHGVDHDPKIYP